MYEEGLFDRVLNFHINYTICDISSMFSKCIFVKQKMELFRCENCENLFNAKDYIPSHGTLIHNFFMYAVKHLNSYNLCIDDNK